MSPRLAEHSETNEVQDIDKVKDHDGVEVAHIRIWRVDGESRLYVKSKAIEDFIKAIFIRANGTGNIYKLIESASLPPTAPYLGNFYPVKAIRLNNPNIIPPLSNGEFKDYANALYRSVDGMINWTWLAAVGLSDGVEYRLSASPLKTSVLEDTFDALKGSIIHTLANQTKVNLEAKILHKEV